MQRVRLLLETELVARRTGLYRSASAEAIALIPDDRLYGRKQLCRCHQSHRDSSPAEHRFDDLAMAVTRHDDTVLHRVAADDAACRNAEAQNRIRSGGELVDHLARRRSEIEDAGVCLLEDDHAASLDSRV